MASYWDGRNLNFRHLLNFPSKVYIFLHLFQSVSFDRLHFCSTCGVKQKNLCLEAARKGRFQGRRFILTWRGFPTMAWGSGIGGGVFGGLLNVECGEMTGEGGVLAAVGFGCLFFFVCQSRPSLSSRSISVPLPIWSFKGVVVAALYPFLYRFHL
jgi:hypothetical protein